MENNFSFTHDYFGKTKGTFVTVHTEDYLFVLASVRNTDFIFIYAETPHDIADLREQD